MTQILLSEKETFPAETSVASWFMTGSSQISDKSRCSEASSVHLQAFHNDYGYDIGDVDVTCESPRFFESKPKLDRSATFLLLDADFDAMQTSSTKDKWRRFFRRLITIIETSKVKTHLEDVSDSRDSIAHTLDNRIPSHFTGKNSQQNCGLFKAMDDGPSIHHHSSGHFQVDVTPPTSFDFNWMPSSTRLILTALSAEPRPLPTLTRSQSPSNSSLFSPSVKMSPEGRSRAESMMSPRFLPSQFTTDSSSKKTLKSPLDPLSDRHEDTHYQKGSGWEGRGGKGSLQPSPKSQPGTPPKSRRGPHLHTHCAPGNTSGAPVELASFLPALAGVSHLVPVKGGNSISRFMASTMAAIRKRRVGSFDSQVAVSLGE